MNSNSLSRPAVWPDILHFAPDFVNSSVEDYKSAISDEEIMNQQQISNIWMTFGTSLKVFVS